MAGHLRRQSRTRFFVKTAKICRAVELRPRRPAGSRRISPGRWIESARLRRPCRPCVFLSSECSSPSCAPRRLRPDAGRNPRADRIPSRPRLPLPLLRRRTRRRSRHSARRQGSLCASTSRPRPRPARPSRQRLLRSNRFWIPAVGRRTIAPLERSDEERVADRADRRRGDPRPERTCPNCGATLFEEKCELRCPNRACGYFASCSDFY